jgi:hypothetical protein
LLLAVLGLRLVLHGLLFTPFLALPGLARDIGRQIVTQTGPEGIAIPKILALVDFRSAILSDAVEATQMRRMLLLVLGLLLVAPAAHAGGFFIGGSLLQAGVEVDTSDFDEDDTGVKFFGGYNFVKYFGVEAAYADLGKAEESGASIETTSLSAFAVGTLPVGKRFELFAKGGVYRWDAEIIENGQAEDDDVETAYGLGAKLKLGDKAAIRLEYEIFEIEFEGAADLDVDIISAGFEWRFGS